MEYFSTEAAFFKAITSNFIFGNFQKFYGNTMFWKIMFQHIIQPINITPRFCKLSSQLFLCAFCALYINRNYKDTMHPYGRRLDATLYIDQNIIQGCQSEILKIWRMQIFLFKKLGYFSLNKNNLKSQKKIGLQAISPHFESVSSSIEVFWGASDLLCV